MLSNQTKLNQAQTNKKHQCGINIPMTLEHGQKTKDKIEMEMLLDQVSWSSIVSRTPK